MKSSKNYIWIIILVVILIIAGGFYLMIGEKDNGEKTPSVPSPTPTPTPSIAVPSPSPTETEPELQTYNVEMRNMVYSPATLTIKKGETVTWTNYDKGTSHTVTSTTGNELGSEFLKTGESYSHTFEKEGKFVYYCIPHSGTHGEIIVK